jgi:ATP-binding cassette subfamily B protein
MVARHYGKNYNTRGIREISGFGKEGVSLLGISDAAEKIGFRTRGVQLTFQQLVKEATLPCILYWESSHFVVLAGVKRSLGGGSNRLQIADPARGIIMYTQNEFLAHWHTVPDETGEQLLGAALLLDPSPAFYDLEGEKEGRLTWSLSGQYLRQSKGAVAQVLVALLVTSFLQLIFPFLTQSVVDNGINTQNLQFVSIVLIAQTMLIFGRTVVDFIRTRLLLSISIVVNLSILSDFWAKLIRLPIAYFERHHTGDTLQRLNDNKQIQEFLTGSAVNTIFSVFNFLIYSVVLVIYDLEIFLIFVAGSALYFLWIKLFLGIRRKLNYQIFDMSAKENNATLQLVQGMQEIKLNNAERLRKWEWEDIQVRIFKLNFKSLNYSQFQQAGALLISHGKDILITFIVARLVIDTKLTLGAMLAIQYILGQLSGFIEQIISFVQTGQDAKISMERLNEIHQLPDEEDPTRNHLTVLPEHKDLQFRALSFTYPGAGNEPVLDNINLHIPAGKITAIVGVSGSGKTTILKLLLKFYDGYSGEIKIGGQNFRYLSPASWRKHCGSVLQDGYIFNDTIARNIAVSDDINDHPKLIRCCQIANVLDFVESLPNGFHTRLGTDGSGISQGQKQRLLIARAIYKDPDYLFFDEATNALDANNEKAIVENLQEFFKGRTVIIVAHRLSTVQNADKIIVLNNGAIEEEGTHTQLSMNRGRYYELVKNQLELGN